MKPHFYKIGNFDEPFRIQEDILPYFYDKFHFHPQCQITIILKGSGTYIVGNSIGRFQENDVFVLGENLPHVFKSDEIYFISSTDNVHAVSVFFNENFFDNKLEQNSDFEVYFDFLKKSKSGMFIKNYDSDSDFKNLLIAKGFNKVVAFVRILSKIFELQNAVLLNNNPDYNFLRSEKLEKIYEFTLNNFKNKISLLEISELVSMTPNAFCKFFKTKTGQTFNNFLNEMRVAHACACFKNSSLTVADVAYQSGFNNLANFNRQFSSITNMSPKKYQQQISNSFN
jgi:AraC-like DNA-binding protein